MHRRRGGWRKPGHELVEVAANYEWLGVGRLLSRRKRPGRTALAYRAKRVPFSDAELRFLDTLDGAVGQDQGVFA
jgi:hypothetical protein